MNFDLFSILASVPWVVAHPWFLAFLLPTFFWVVAHVWAKWGVAPTDASSTWYKTLYPFINAFIAANWGHSKNAIADDLQALGDSPQPAPAPVPVANTATK